MIGKDWFGQMGIIDSIKNDSIKTGAKIQSNEARELEIIFNKMFFLERDIEEETKFVNQVMTRGLGSQERIGLHASAMIVGDNSFCIRQQVLSLIYKQLQGEQLSVGLKRIYEEGNAIHEKWQRLLIRAGYAKANTLDRTRFDDEYILSFTPDIVCRIPEFYDGAMVGEIKSVNTYQFKNMTSHPSAHKQLEFYMMELIKQAKLKGKWNGKDYLKGFVLCDDKNTQDFKLFIYDYDPEFVAPYIDRCEEVRHYYDIAISENKLPSKRSDCKSYDCKMADTCPMKDACWNRNNGRVKI